MTDPYKPSTQIVTIGDENPGATTDGS